MVSDVPIFNDLHGEVTKFPVSRIPDLATAIDDLLWDRTVMRERKDLAEAKVKAESWPRVAKMHEEFYQGLLA